MRADPLADLVTEKDWMAQVVELARLFGWRTYHPWLSARSQPGFPDLCMVRDERLLFVECKAERGKVTRAQEDWLNALSRVPGVEVYCWRPSDRDGAAEVLRGAR